MKMKNKIKSLFNIIMLIFPRYFSVKIKFFIKHRYKLNLSSPKTFNEKIQYRKLKENIEVYARCADKVAVREYLNDKGFGEILIPTYYIGNKIPDMNFFESVKDGFVLKRNDDCGGVVIKQKDEVITREEIKNLSSSRLFNYGTLHNEPWYSKITTKYIVEKLLLERGELPRDYKFHVFSNGKIFLQIDFDRKTNHTQVYLTEDLEFADIKFAFDLNVNFKISSLPKNIKSMFELARDIGRDFSYVRVDLYSVDNRIYFGELTFSPGGGLSRMKNYKQDLELGKNWKI